MDMQASPYFYVREKYMLKYDTILWDLDGTLLNFQMSQRYALGKILGSYGVTVTEEMISLYSGINDVFWEKLERGEIEKTEMLAERFRAFFHQAGIEGIDPKEMMERYEGMLGYICAIIYDALITIDFIRWLKKKNPQCRLVYLYTNPVSKAINPTKLPNVLCEKWTTDKKDSDEYGIKYIGDGGYFRNWVIAQTTPQYDVIFVGRDKGRLDYLLNLKARFEQAGLRVNFYITAYHRYQHYRKSIYKPLVPYTEVLQMISNAKAILHLVNGGQTGVSIRVMEAIIHKKKLITDNTLLKSSVFYHPDNFFILEEDDMSELVSFLKRPLHEYPESLVETLFYENILSKAIDEV